MEVIVTIFWPVFESARGRAAGLLNHPFRRQLRQEIRAFDVDGHEPVKARLARFQNIRARFGRDTRVVHENIQSAERGPGEFDQPGAVVGV